MLKIKFAWIVVIIYFTSIKPTQTRSLVALKYKNHFKLTPPNFLKSTHFSMKYGSGEENQSRSTLTVSTTNLVKNCVGAGVFSLTNKVSSISLNPQIIYQAGLLIFAMASWAAYNFYMVGETCRITNSTTYTDAWSNAVSLKSAWIVQIVTLIAPIVSCLANTIVLGDILSMLMRTVGIPPLVYENRRLVIFLLTSIILFPLCIFKDLSALKSISTIGVFGHLVSMLTLFIRIRDKSYFPGGKYYADFIADQASLPIQTPAAANWFVLASLLSYCFVAHYNAPRYYTELKDKDKNPNLFPSLAITSYMISSIIYVGTAYLGLNLFGTTCKSFALNSFSSADPLASLARISFGTSVLASFPLIFISIRTYFVKKLKTSSTPVLAGIKRVSFLLLAFIAFLAIEFTDIGFVGALSGGILGSSMMFIFPPIMYSCALYRQAKSSYTQVPLRQIFLNGVLMMMGAALGLLGTTNTLTSFLKK